MSDDRCPGCGGNAHIGHWTGCPTLLVNATVTTVDVGYVHTGHHAMPDGIWVCSETCPHPTHDEEG